ncbi:peroxisome biogenesis protein 16-like [Dorcoceras hygrometricum]|nr:peroxisome biogenesis protein 16-like [Dorcoceras hygrometricum]
MDTYKRWVRRNKDYVHSLESLANGFTWLLPERFSDSEIGPEAVTSILGMVTALNEHIINTMPVQTRTGSGEPSSFPFSLCITLLKDLETLVEVVAQQFYGEEKKWNFIAITEATKALLRLATLQKSGYKMLLHGGESTNDGKDYDDCNAHRNEFASSRGQHGASGVLSNNHGQGPYNLEGRALFALNRFGENARTVTGPSWLHRVQHQQPMMEPPTTVSQTPTLYTFLSEKEKLIELLVGAQTRYTYMSGS